MRKNMISEYDTLMREMENLEDKYELELYRKVNARINTILSESHNQVEKLEALICTFEAKSTYDSYNANLALAYAVVSFNFGILTNVLDFSGNKQIVAMIVFGISVFATILFGSAWREHKLEQNRTFILNLLRFRYEEIKNSETLPEKTKHSKKKTHR